MVASVEVPPHYDLPGLAEAAGNGDINARRYQKGRLYVQDVTQEALDAALASYSYIDTVKERKRMALRAQADAWLYGQYSLQQLVFAALQIGTPGDIAGIKQTAVDRNQALADALDAVDAATTVEEVQAIRFEDHVGGFTP